MGKKRGPANIDGNVLDSLGWGVMVVGRWSRIILAYNRRMADITGIPAREAVGMGVADVFGHMEGLDLEALDAEIRESGGFETRSLRLQRPDGELAYRHLRGDVLQGFAGEEEGVVVSLQDVSEREFMRQNMNRYLPKEVAELVHATRPGARIAGREVEVAVLVADMRDFTATAEGLTPEELFHTINGYLEPMVDVVAQHGGMIDKFTGDGFMAVFGAPTTSGDEARRAIMAALDLTGAVNQVVAEREGNGLPRLDIGYGIHWGPALAGGLGSLLRMEYTVVGDTVNIAHRVQALAGPGEILATRAVTRAAGDDFQWGDGRWVRVKGRKAPVKVHPALGRVHPADGE
jgi:PAS domain S-box-containing protein